MNSRCLIEVNELNMSEFMAGDMPEEHSCILRKYMDMGQHLLELDQLYRMMLYNVEAIFRDYDWRFNDVVFSRTHEDVDVIVLNALIGNAVSFDRGRIYFQLEEILETPHININSNLKKMERIKSELTQYGVVDMRLK